MKRKLTLLFTLFIVMALLLAACGGGEEEPAADTGGEAAAEEEMAAEEGGGEEEMASDEAAAAEEQTLLIGFTASQTGRYNTESSRQINGLDLWMEGINATGVTMPDGSVIKFDAVFYDDESNTDRVQELYTRLATEDNADFLISPYSSGLTDASAIIAEQYGKVMITTGAASDSTYQKGFQNVFQTYTPASRYLTGALDLLQSTDPDAQKLAIVYENSKFSTDVATALNDYAESLGYEVVLFEGYDPETTDFAPFINKIQESEPDAIMGGGHFQDGSTFVKQLEEKQVPVNMVSLLVAPPDPSFAELGEAAMGVVGPSQWEPLADFNAAKASEEGMDFYGPSSAEFTQAYVDAYGEEPSYHAAGGYVAGLLLQKAIEDAGTTDPEAIRQSLENLDLMTFFGHMKFDTSAESHGLQVGHSMIYVQWQDEGGELVKQVVWPTAGATADTLYPMP
ncbi:MAG: amino acid ABC transporter substrate-binding protein [Candidatus Promineifilaceae bacterium]|nr:amino acid ABC transporter substrate-binding protein [Candidatus Promineifilaceae bacterium]